MPRRIKVPHHDIRPCRALHPPNKMSSAQRWKLRLSWLPLSGCFLQDARQQTKANRHNGVMISSYVKLESLSETNPRRDSIVGMWHRQADGVGIVTKSRSSLLFQRDGKGVCESLTVLGGDSMPPVQVTFVWEYLGKGVWNMQASGSDHRSECPAQSCCCVCRVPTARRIDQFIPGWTDACRASVDGPQQQQQRDSPIDLPNLNDG